MSNHSFHDPGSARMIANHLRKTIPECYLNIEMKGEAQITLFFESPNQMQRFAEQIDRCARELAGRMEMERTQPSKQLENA